MRRSDSLLNYNGFKVGDEIKAITDKYSYTNKTNGYIGVVVRLLPEKLSTGADILVRTTYCEDRSVKIDKEFNVISDRFELHGTAEAIESKRFLDQLYESEGST